MAGCDSDAKIAKSSPGESCTKTSDCEDGLKCLDGTCYKSATSSGGSANSEGGEGNTAGTTVVGPKPPVLGKLGESCTRRADCVDGLACLSQRCSKDAVPQGEGGEGSGGPALGAVGETCGLTSDCSEGLACLPQTGGGLPIADAIGSNSVGVCTEIDNGLTPTGNACGAECKTAEDCCELPVAVHVPYAAVSTPGVSGPYGTGANSCTQLAALLEGVNCATTALAAQRAQCFAQSAYCNCGTKTWACSDAGRCEYKAACLGTVAATGSVPGGCPSYTRIQSGLPLSTACNTAKKCAPETADTGCTADADCDETVFVADSGATDYCTGGKCVCNTDNGLCYRGCSEDLDCPVHFTCDTTTSLCTSGKECETDSFCVTKSNNINAKCVEGSCQGSCNNDRDCNGGQLTSYTETRICNADHVCEMIGCESDDQCPTVGGVRTFCTKAPELMAPGGVVSAVTD